MHKDKKRHTVKEMLRESIIMHVLRNQQALVSLSTITNQIHQSLVPDLPNPRSLCLQNKSINTDANILHKRNIKKINESEAYHKLTRVGPGLLGEALDGD